MRRILLSLFLALLAAPMARAQQSGLERGSQLITGFTGPIFDLGGEPEDVEGDGTNGLEFESDWAFGGSYQYFLTPNLSLETSLTYGTGEGEIEGAGADDPEDDEGNGEEAEEENGEEGESSAHGLYFTGGIVYNFRPGGRLKPYVSAGAGLVRIDVDGSGTSRLAGAFGAGLLLRLSESLLLRVDGRDYLYTLDQGGSSSTRSDLALTGGVSIQF
jgi:outer membrane beta-barrel protein